MSLDFSHLEIYFIHYSAKFTKPADPLVLFVHWSMIQNKFRCINESESHHTLPSNWLSNDSFYDIKYKKHDVIYRMEIYIANECALIQLKNMENLMDSSQYVKIEDFIDTDNFKSDRQFSKIYKDLHRLYTSIKWSIDRFRYKLAGKGKVANSKEAAGESNEPIIPSSVSSSQTQLSKNSRKETKKNFSLIFDILSNKLSKSNPEAVRELNSKLYNSTYSEFLNQIKKEKAEFESNVEIYRRNSISSSKSNEVISSSSSNNLFEFGNQKQKKTGKKNRSSLRKTNAGGEESDADSLKPKISPDDKDNVERDKINRDLLFDYNPITNYFNFNNKTDRKKIDQKLIEEDEFVKKAYEKFNVKKFCEVKIFDCFSSDLFKGLKAPIKLNDEMKRALKLEKENEDDQYDDIVVDVKKKKYHKVRKNIWRDKRRAKPKKKKNEARKKPTNINTSKNDVSILEQSSDLVNFFKHGTLKRKRSESSESALPTLDDSDPAEKTQVINLEENEEHSNYKSPNTGKKTTPNDSVVKKLTFSATVQSSIVISRIEPALDDTLPINLFADESQRPSKRTRRESQNEIVDLDNSIEQEENVENKSQSQSQIRIESPWKITPLKKSRLTPKTTPLRQIVAKPAGTPSAINSRLKEIINCSHEIIDESLTPAKFYKNMTSTQVNDENRLDEKNSIETFEQNKMIDRE